MLINVFVEDLFFKVIERVRGGGGEGGVFVR